jgi:hypothetical protein
MAFTPITLATFGSQLWALSDRFDSIDDAMIHVLSLCSVILPACVTFMSTLRFSDFHDTLL